MRVIATVALLTCAICSVSSAQTARPNNATVTPANPSNVAQSAAKSPKQAESISAEASDMFLGLVQEINHRPERNAVEVNGKGLGWKETTKEMNAMLNAKRGFVGKLAGQVVFLGSDGTNDIFSIAVEKNFDSVAIHDRIKNVVNMKVVGSNTSMGQKTDMYRIFDGTKDLGLLSMTYGVAEAIRGTGTIGYISSARAKREGIIR